MRTRSRVFFPQDLLDDWLTQGKADLAGQDLTLSTEATGGDPRTFKVAEAVHVTREVSGSDDANDLVGRVKSRPYLDELGAEIFETSMVLGDNAYDVVPGWLGRPASSQAPGAETDEALLARVLLVDAAGEAAPGESR